MIAVPLFIAVVVAAFVYANASGTESMHHAMTDAAQHQTCGMYHGGHAMMEGVLTAQFDTKGNLSGWTCRIMTHMNCTAGPDGVWSTCDYPPDLGWPAPVPKEALDHPSSYSQSSSAQSTP